ncbi:MAG: hypothetical protein AB1758_12725, partial [Candidatus Eremiobacterota bacterium]
MNKSRIWPSTLLIVGLGVASSFTTVGGQLFSAGTCPFAGSCPTRVEAPGSPGAMLYNQTMQEIESRYPGKVDPRELTNGAAAEVNRAIRERGGNATLLTFLQAMYLPGQPDRYISAASSQIPANEAWQAASRGLVAGLNDRQARWLSPAELQAYQTLCSLPM